MARVTLQDVAVHAGVSSKTVSNVIHGYEHVRPGMRDRVQAAIAELGYQPDVRARSLVTGRTGIVTFAFPDLRRPYFAELAHVFSEVGREHEVRFLFEETGGTLEGERDAFRTARIGVADGVILHLDRPNGTDVTDEVGGMPLVLLGETDPGDVDHVVVDNRAAAATAVEHLAALGRRRIGFLGHEPSPMSLTSELRLEGYRLGLERSGIPFDPAFLVPRVDGSARSAEVALTEALDRGLRVDALLCRDDLAAIGGLRALRIAGVTVPRDVAVIGWDAINLAASLVPSLTSVAADGRALAERALEMLDDRISGTQSPGRRVTVGHHLSFGESAPER